MAAARDRGRSRDRGHALGIPGLATIAALCTAGVAVVVAIAATPSWQRDDWRGVVSRLPGTVRAVLVAPSEQTAPVRYYERKLVPGSDAGIRTRELIVLSEERTLPHDVRVPPQLALVSEERVVRWTLRRFRSPSPVLVPAQPGLLVRLPE